MRILHISNFQTSIVSFSELREPILMILGAKWPHSKVLLEKWNEIIFLQNLSFVFSENWSISRMSENVKMISFEWSKKLILVGRMAAIPLPKVPQASKWVCACRWGRLTASPCRALRFRWFFGFWSVSISKNQPLAHQICFADDIKNICSTVCIMLALYQFWTESGPAFRISALFVYSFLHFLLPGNAYRRAS